MVCATLGSLGVGLILSLLCANRIDGVAQPLKISAFNMQIFGKTKYSKPAVVAELKKIIPRNDITLLQEIKESKNVSFPALMTDLMGTYSWLDYELGKRLGRTNSKEQYAIAYNKSRLMVIEKYEYNDKTDHFEREPMCVLFNSTDSAVESFGVCGIHVKPTDAVAEIDYLADVYTEVSARFGTENIIITGDFNADCSYVPEYQWANIRLYTDPKFTWHIGHDADTSVYTSTDCAYDRFVTAGKALKDAVIPDTAKPFLFDVEHGLSYEEAKLVSDHYPIEMQLYWKHVYNTTFTSEIVAIEAASTDPTTMNPSGFSMITNDISSLRLEVGVTCTHTDAVAKMNTFMNNNPTLLKPIEILLVRKILEGGLFDLNLQIQDASFVENCILQLEYKAVPPYDYTVFLIKQITSM